MTLFLCAAGTSIMGGPPRPAAEGGAAQQIEAKVAREREAANGNREKFLVRVSAETNGLLRAGAGPSDQVVFLVSDTPEGQAAAQRLVALGQTEFGCHARAQVIAGLQMSDGPRFQREAIDALFTTLDNLTRDVQTDQVRINATGGFKGTLPYLVLYGMVEGIEVSYVYEWSNTLIRLPPLPIRFDWARLAGAAAAMFAICENAALPENDWRALLPDDYYARQAEYDALFLFEGGLVGLSGPGYLVQQARGQPSNRPNTALGRGEQSAKECGWIAPCAVRDHTATGAQSACAPIRPAPGMARERRVRRPSLEDGRPECAAHALLGRRG